MILFALVCACLVLEFQTFNANIKNLDGLFILTIVNCDITRHVDSAGTGLQYQYLKIEKKNPDWNYLKFEQVARLKLKDLKLLVITVTKGGLI